MTNSEHDNSFDFLPSRNPLYVKHVETLKKGIVGLDGPWSATSKLIAELHRVETRSLEMDSNWVLTPEGWVCPSCKRNKAQIARFDRTKSIVLCKLHEHHDHFVDYAERRLKNEVSRAGQNSENLSFREQSREHSIEHVFDKIASMVESFSRILICEFCNAFEAELKKASNLKIVEFSFSAEDIRECLVLDEAAPHINKPKLEQIAVEARHHLETRKRVLNFLIAELRENRSWYLWARGESKSRIQAKADDFIRASGLWLTHHYEYIQIHASRPRPQKTDSRAWRTKKLESIPTPPREIVEQNKVAFWNNIPDAWICPVCNRSKFDQIRRSPKFDYAIIPKEVWIEIDGSKQKTYICRDCHFVRGRLAAEAEIGAHIVPLEIVNRAIKEARPHSSHRIAEDEIIDKIVEELLDLAYAEYDSFDEADDWESA